MKSLRVFCLLCALVLPSHALDRHAFTFTRYDLNATIEPEQQRLGMRGQITLRNDSESPQRNFVLQISSTLHWVSIQVDGKPVEFVSQLYTSDIDHTGSLSEAVIVLPRQVAPKQSIDLDIGYEGIIPQDATRETRIGVPADVAMHSDWDQISKAFTAVRGIGYVAWYPIATEAVSLSEGNSVFEEVGRWQQREAQTEMKVRFIHSDSSGFRPILFCDAIGQSISEENAGRAYSAEDECRFGSLLTTLPVFAIANYAALDRGNVNISYLPSHKSGADNYALAVEQVSPLIAKWFGDHREKPE
ncbi:MAG TPA: hypothetical protein VGU90_00615, partial [Terriglobales bacterium]|nr:hypothetical protein [Terriglobales bacterium]